MTNLRRTLLGIIFLVALTMPARSSGAGILLLKADFEDKAVDEPIGTGGPGAGEPVDVSPAVFATVRDAPMPTRCLEIADNDDFAAGGVWFEFADGMEILDGVVHLAADLWFPTRESYYVYVRENGSAAQSFITMHFTADGNVRANDKDNQLGIIGAYETARLFPVELVYDMDAGTYDVILDGNTVVDDEPHGVVSRGVGSLLFGTLNDPNLDGALYVDNVQVWVESDTRVLAGHLDIKPGGCVNPVNVKNLGETAKNSNSNRGGVLPVAMCGAVDFDVTHIDMSTLRLEGVVPLRRHIADVSAPAGGEDECDCVVQGPDGIMDLSLKFRKADVVEALGVVYNGDQVSLTLTGSLMDGTQFEASDCILVRGNLRDGNAKGGEPTLVRIGAMPQSGRGAPKAFALHQNYPNPFNPVTTIRFDVASGGGQVALRVYDVRGRLVRILTHGMHPAGQVAKTWDGRDDNGIPVASGAYFVRLTAPGFVETRRMVLLR